MNFTTNIFLLCFLPISLIIYICIDKIDRTNNFKIGNLFLILLSLVFYRASGTISIKLFLAYMLIVWFFGKILDKYKKKSVLFAEIFIIVSILIYYKYLGFALNQISNLFSLTIGTINIVAPLGISFIIFESISYLADIYMGYAESGNLFDVMLFISFFPKIVSGPIVLWRDFNKQIKNHKTDVDKIELGIQRIIIGVSKKVLIADILGLAVSKVWASFPQIDAISAWLCGLCYMGQIYFDFSGYSDIAIGLCKLFGFEIKENFDYPYLSTSISEFWRKWHISLGTWFRNYIYIPLGGNRHGNTYLNLFVVFLITGIWHGASYTYFLWGIIQGIVVVIERRMSLSNENDSNKFKAVRLFVTLSITYFSWILFCSPSVSSFMEYIKIMFGKGEMSDINFAWQWYFNTRTLFVLLVSMVLSFVKIDVKWFNPKYKNIKYLSLIILFVLSIVFMVNSNYSPFLYFKF